MQDRLINKYAPWAWMSVLLLGAAAIMYIAPPAGSDGEPSLAYTFDEVSLGAFLSCMDGEALILSAHRGGPGDRRPENAMSTFAATVRVAPAILEMDITRSSDGVLFLMHDDTFDRTTLTQGSINRPWAEVQDIQLIDANGRPAADRVPGFADVLEWARGRAILTLDRKNDVPWADIAQVIREAEMESAVLPIAYTLEDAVEIHAALPRAMISASIYDADDLDLLTNFGVPEDQIVAWTGAGEVDEALHNFLDARGIPVIHAAFEGGPDGLDLPDEVAASLETALDQGIDILAVNQPRAAWRHLTQSSGEMALLQSYGACLQGG